MVGAGIVGLTAAYLLVRVGLSVTVLEARRIGRQVTGRSTAKITRSIHSFFVISDLEAEATAARKVGFEADFLDRAPLPFKTAGALRFKNQAQFNPAQYLIGLAKATAAAGASVFEESRVTSVDESDGWHLTTDKSALRAKPVVLATNLPIAGPVPMTNERDRGLTLLWRSE